MIAPIKESPPSRRPSALQAARLAVADVLLARPGKSAHATPPTASWRAWLLVGSLIALTVAFLLTMDWWTIENY